MPERLKEFLQRWIVSTVAALIATYMLSGITYQTWVDLFVATFILGLLNTFVRPILMLFSLPLLIFTLRQLATSNPALLQQVSGALDGSIVAGSPVQNLLDSQFGTCDFDDLPTVP